MGISMIMRIRVMMINMVGIRIGERDDEDQDDWDIRYGLRMVGIKMMEIRMKGIRMIGIRVIGKPN